MAATREDLILRIRAEGTQQFNRAMGGIRETVKKVKFEWLGIMFAGMALQRVFGGLVQAQLELFGVTKILAAAWTIVLLPIMDLLLPVILFLLELFMDMPETMKLVVGILVLLGAAFGAVLAIIGQLVLGISALAIVFGVSFAVVVTSIMLIIGALVGVGLVIAGIIIAVQNLGKDWSKVFHGLGVAALGVGLILFVAFGWFPALIAVIVAGLLFLVSFLIKKFPQIGAFFQKYFYEVPKGWITKLWDYVRRFFGWIGDKFGSVFNFVAGGFAGGSNRGVLGSFQTGGIVPRTGPYTLHQGETVVPAGNSNTLAPSITVNVSGEQGINARALADELQRYWVEDFEKISQGRSR